MKLYTRKEIQERERTALEDIQVKEQKAARALAKRINELNKTDEEFSQKIREKEQEYAQAQAKYRQLIFGSEQTILVLEERRKAALQPIETEWRKVRESQESIADALRSLEEEMRQNTKIRQQLSEIDSEIKERERAVEKLRTDVLHVIESRIKEAEAREAAAKAELTQLTTTQKKIEDTQVEYRKREESMKRAENKAKAAIATADARILEEKKEQKKTDEKRQMLGIAIQELKKRGLWHKKQYGTAIK